MEFEILFSVFEYKTIFHFREPDYPGGTLNQATNPVPVTVVFTLKNKDLYLILQPNLRKIENNKYG